jgi:hypothetical protein
MPSTQSARQVCGWQHGGPPWRSRTDVDSVLHDLKRSRFCAVATLLPVAMYVTVIGLASALITDSVWPGEG